MASTEELVTVFRISNVARFGVTIADAATANADISNRVEKLVQINAVMLVICNIKRKLLDG